MRATTYPVSGGSILYLVRFLFFTYPQVLNSARRKIYRHFEVKCDSVLSYETSNMSWYLDYPRPAFPTKQISSPNFVEVYVSSSILAKILDS